tara:strand:- start:5640 stop:6581 length:942 start_codon:yes stop_codon:yes gene_type:complete
MKPKLFINFGLPKTSSTNLQKNFYPFIKNVNYLGRTQGGGLDGNSKLFKELNIYIEGGENTEFSKNRLDELKQEFKKNLKNEINLISMENWAFPYQRNVQNNKIEIVSQFEKLARLKKFVEDLDVEFSFFVIHRNPVDGIVSLFVTAQNRIEKIFGPEYLQFKKFLLKYENNDNDYKNIKLLFDVYNIKKIKEVFYNTNLKIFDYNDIKNYPDKFINNFYNYLELKTDYSLLKNIKTKTGVSPLKKGNYFVKTPSYLFVLLKKLIPKYLKDKIKFLFSFSILKKVLLRDNVITEEDIKKLTKLLIKENNLNKN